jgi:hypothetical protein
MLLGQVDHLFGFRVLTFTLLDKKSIFYELTTYPNFNDKMYADLIKIYLTG